MESHFNQDQNVVIGFLRNIRVTLPSTSILLPKFKSDGFVPFIIIHYVYFYYFRRLKFLMLSSGSAEAQNTKYNNFRIINFPNLYEQKNEIKYDAVKYILKLHPWKKNLNQMTAKLNLAGPKKQKSKKKSDKKRKTNKRKSGGANLMIPGAIDVTSTGNQKKGKRSASPTLGPVSSKKNSKKMKPKMHAHTKSVGFLGAGLNLDSVFDDDDEDDKKKKKSKKSKHGHLRRAKSMATLRGKTSATFTPSKICTNINFDKYSFGKCLISTLELPKWGWLKKKKIESGSGERYGSYQLFLRCGGIKAEFDDHTDENDLILLNSANCNYNGIVGSTERDIVLDAYYQKLPSFRKTLESPNIVYDKKSASLLSIGGYCDGKSQTVINECCLNVKSVSSLKWRRNKNKQQLLRGRYGTGVQYIENNKYLIMGGTNDKSKHEKTCEIYNNYDKCEDEYCLSASNMNFKRNKLSSTYLPNKKKVIIAGGMIYGKGSTQVEIYDIIKNRWILHKSEFNFEHKFPLIWMDFHDPNICYVAGDWINFGGRKDSLGYVEWLDLRSKPKKWNMFSNDTLAEYFNIVGIRANIWESRSLSMW